MAVLPPFNEKVTNKTYFSSIYLTAALPSSEEKEDPKTESLDLTTQESARSRYCTNVISQERPF